jgi:hypothetical protein
VQSLKIPPDWRESGRVGTALMQTPTPKSPLPLGTPT